MTGSNHIGPSDEELDLVAEHLMNRPPQETLRWEQNQYNPTRANATSETHRYSIDATDLDDSYEVTLRIYPQRGEMDLPMRKTTYHSPKKAKKAAMDHHQRQLKHAEQVAARLALLPIELEPAFQRFMWQTTEVGDGGLLETLLCAWLGVDNFDDPALTTRIVYRAYPQNESRALADTPIPTPAPATPGIWQIVAPRDGDSRIAVQTENGVHFAWFLRPADAVFCVGARNQRLKHAAAHTKRLQEEA